MHATIDALKFDNRFTRELPADTEGENFVRQVAGACFSRVAPTPAGKPILVAFAREVAELVGLSEAACQSAEFAEVFAGNRILPDMEPHATCYGGHQFGNWAGQLGDGRAINLGEAVGPDGRRWALQLKGAGPTPYSRSGDGLAVLRSSVREFLCSEAMHHLGVPTTRALSLVLSGQDVVRDMFYDGRPQFEPGAVVCRVAPTFTRFGNFQIFASRGETEVLGRLVDHTLASDFPHLGPPNTDTYLEWFTEVCQRTMDMVVHWERVGFVHGVMNTDNMSILGLTIDYGPYGWLEDYDPNWTPNTTDASGRRYRFMNQGPVALWNLARFAEAILPLGLEVKAVQDIIEQSAQDYQFNRQQMLARKLGLSEFRSESDGKLIDELQAVLQIVETDMTIFFRNLSQLSTLDSGPQTATNAIQTVLADAFYDASKLDKSGRERWQRWLFDYVARLQDESSDDARRRRDMNLVNPKYVLRNYMAQLAIDQAEAGDYSLVNDLLELLRQPYAEQPDREEFAVRRPEWARHRAGCSMLSCSS